MADTWAGKKVIKWGGIAGAALAILALGSQVRSYLPDYAAAADVEKIRVVLVAGMTANAVEIIAIQQRNNQAAIYRNQAEIDRADRRGADDPDYRTPPSLINERIFLENETTRLRRAMQKLEKSQ